MRGHAGWCYRQADCICLPQAVIGNQPEFFERRNVGRAGERRFTGNRLNFQRQPEYGSDPGGERGGNARTGNGDAGEHAAERDGCARGRLLYSAGDRHAGRIAERKRGHRRRGESCRAEFLSGNHDAFGGDPKGAVFNPQVFTIFTAWHNSANAQQASIERGENIFNTASMQIRNVRGINDNAALGSPAVVQGSCNLCNDTPNVGNHSASLLLDTGATRQAADETDPGILAGLAQLSAPGCLFTRSRGAGMEWESRDLCDQRSGPGRRRDSARM